MGRVSICPLRVGGEQAQRIATKEIFEGLMRPDDISSATAFAGTLEHVPLWHVAIQTSGFHIGLGRSVRRGNVTMPGAALGVRHDVYEQLVVGHRHFPRGYLPIANVKVEREAIVDVESDGLEGTFLPLDVSQTEAEREAVAVAMQRIAPQTAIYANYVPHVTTSFVHYPVWVVRYAYRGMGCRYPGEEFFVTVCGRSGRLLGSHHPAGGGLFGAVGRFFGGRPATPYQPHQPPPPPPSPPAFVPPPQPPPVWTPPAPRAPPPPPPAPAPPPTGTLADPAMSATQVLAIKSALSLAEARTIIARAIDLPEDARPLLVHVPFWRLRLSIAIKRRMRARAPCVFASIDGFVFLVAATGEVTSKEVEPLLELGGFQTPEIAASAIAVTERKALEAGGILLEGTLPRDEAIRILTTTAGDETIALASARLVFAPMYVQKTADAYVVLDGATGAILGKRTVTRFDNARPAA